MALGPGQWSHQVVAGSAAGDIRYLDFRQPDAAAASGPSDSGSDGIRQVRHCHLLGVLSTMVPRSTEGT